MQHIIIYITTGYYLEKQECGKIYIATVEEKGKFQMELNNMWTTSTTWGDIEIIWENV